MSRGSETAPISDKVALPLAMSRRQIRCIQAEAGQDKVVFETTMEPGLWRLIPTLVNPVPNEPFSRGERDDIQNWKCEDCIWSRLEKSAESTPGKEVYVRKCHFNAPEVECLDVLMGSDLDMEQPNTLAWSGFGIGGSISKVAGGHSGARALRVTNGIIPGKSAFQGLFSDAYLSYANPPPRFRVSGWVKSDGSSQPQIGIKANGGATTYGVATGAAIPGWQFLDLGAVSVPYGGLGSVILSLDVNGGSNDNAEFDDIRIELIDARRATWNIVDDADWCSHFWPGRSEQFGQFMPGPNPPTCGLGTIWCRLSDSPDATWKDQNGLVTVGPPGEPLRWNDPPREMWVDGRPRFQCVLPPFTRLTLVQLSRGTTEEGRNDR